MTETRTYEFDHIKKTTRSTEDVVFGLPCFGVEDDKGGILEDGFAEKGKKKRRICEMGPLVVLGSDVMLMILSCLDARSVALYLVDGGLLLLLIRFGAPRSSLNISSWFVGKMINC